MTRWAALFAGFAIVSGCVAPRPKQAEEGAVLRINVKPGSEHRFEVVLDLVAEQSSVQRYVQGKPLLQQAVQGEQAITVRAVLRAQATEAAAQRVVFATRFEEVTTAAKGLVRFLEGGVRSSFSGSAQIVVRGERGQRLPGGTAPTGGFDVNILYPEYPAGPLKEGQAWSARDEPTQTEWSLRVDRIDPLSVTISGRLLNSSNANGLDVRLVVDRATGLLREATGSFYESATEIALQGRFSVRALP